MYNYAFQKVARYIELDNFLKRVLISCCLIQITSFGSFNELKMHQLD